MPFSANFSSVHIIYTHHKSFDADRPIRVGPISLMVRLIIVCFDLSFKHCTLCSAQWLSFSKRLPILFRKVKFNLPKAAHVSPILRIISFFKLSTCSSSNDSFPIPSVWARHLIVPININSICCKFGAISTISSADLRWLRYCPFMFTLNSIRWKKVWGEIFSLPYLSKIFAHKEKPKLHFLHLSN